MAEDRELLVSVHDLKKAFGEREILKGISFDIYRGDVVCVIGPSGSGKSTLIRCVNYLEHPTGGDICYRGESVMKHFKKLTQFRTKVGMVFQSFNLFNNMTVLENCTVGQIKVLGKSKEEAKETALKYLKHVGMDSYVNAKPHQLSGGQKQRVALCRALVKQSPFFFLDEPLSNLDAQLRQKARTELVKIHEMFRPTMVYVTHDQIEAMTVADRIAVMNKGKVQQIDTPDTIYHHPANVFVATFIGSPAMNVVKARIEGTKIVIGECAIEIPAEWLKIVGTRKEVIFGLRPEAAKPNFDNAMVKGTVDFMENTGNLKTASLTLADGQNFFIQDSNQNIDLRNVTGFDFDWTNVNLFDVETEENIGYVEA